MPQTAAMFFYGLDIDLPWLSTLVNQKLLISRSPAKTSPESKIWRPSFEQRKENLVNLFEIVILCKVILVSEAKYNQNENVDRL